MATLSPAFFLSCSSSLRLNLISIALSFIHRISVCYIWDPSRSIFTARREAMYSEGGDAFVESIMPSFHEALSIVSTAKLSHTP